MTVAYDSLGNITEKSDVCATANCMVYGAGAAGPHALTSIVGTYNGVVNPTFAYDANGNMASGGGRAITVTSFNMAASITDGTNSAAFTYDSEHQRISQVTTGTNAGTTLYLNDPVSGAMEEQFTASGASAATLRDYILADGHMVALRTATPASSPQWGTAQWGSFTWGTGTPASVTLLYFTLDHLGSISVVADSTGTVVERDSYDAWGKRRNADGSAANCGTVTSATTRGFTGQEMMDGICLINFNARIYDPSLGRFMSPDPVTETVYNLQVLNRYSYVGNNPLSLTDPSGLCFLGCFWKQSWFKSVIAIAAAIVLSEFILPDLELGSGLVDAFGEAGISGAQAASLLGYGALNAGIAGGVAGAITGGLKGALLGALQAGLFYGAGNLLQGPGGFTVFGSHDLGTLVAHGLVGGLVSVAQGGNFGSGFLAAGIATFAPTPVQGESFEEIAEGTAESAVLGGIGSELGGGKFANGAITGAFAYAAGSIASNQSQTSDTQDGLANGASDCGSDAYACTRVNPDTDRAEIEYTDLYNKLDPIEQAAVTAHEEVHVGQIDNFIDTNVTVWDRLENFFDPSVIPNKVYSWVDMNRAALEMPAYNAGIAYLNAHQQDYGGVYAGSVSRMIWEQTYTRDLIKSGKITGGGD